MVPWWGSGPRPPPQPGRARPRGGPTGPSGGRSCCDIPRRSPDKHPARPGHEPADHARFGPFSGHLPTLASAGIRLLRVPEVHVGRHGRGQRALRAHSDCNPSQVRRRLLPFYFRDGTGPRMSAPGNALVCSPETKTSSPATIVERNPRARFSIRFRPPGRGRLDPRKAGCDHCRVGRH